jgi:hypothetical protein
MTFLQATYSMVHLNCTVPVLQNLNFLRQQRALILIKELMFENVSGF